MDCKAADIDAFFRLFTACPKDPKALLIDVRPNKEFKKRHIQNAYNVRVSTNGRILADYSQAHYDISWSQDCWWGNPVFVYGPMGLKKDHPVIEFLVREGKCSMVRYLKEGYEEFEHRYPFICTSLVKGGNSIKRYPAQIVPGLLYLGDWGHAQQVERLQDLNINRVVTIHNNPDNLHLPSTFKHLKFELADLDIADISQFFQPTYEFIEQARHDGKAVLVHCGAGVSRSAALVMMYLMRHERWNASKAREHCVSRRSLVCPNDGFWRTLCALEASLGIMDRSDPTATAGGHGADAPEIAADAAGEPVPVRMISAKELKLARQATAAPEPVAKRPRLGSVVQLAPIRHSDEDDSSPQERRRKDGDRKRHRDDDSPEGSHRGKGSRTEGEGRQRRHEREGDAGSSGDGSGHPDRGLDDKNSEEGHGEEAGTIDAAGGTEATKQQEGTEVVLDVLKEGTLLGELHIGPMRLHQQCVFGRAPNCDVVLEHLSISRMHAQITVDTAGGAAIMDLGSGHGTKVNDTWVIARKPHALKVGTTFLFGASTRLYKVKELVVHKPAKR